MILHYTYQSKYTGNKFPTYVITNHDPRLENGWSETNYKNVFIGIFDSNKDALESIKKFEPNFSEWELLEDSYLQGEIVFVRE